MSGLFSRPAQQAEDESATEMYLVADLATSRISETNQALLDCIGETKLVGKSVLEICEASSIPALERALVALENQLEVKNVELKLRRAGGANMPVLMSARTAAGSAGERQIQAWCRDITTLKNLATLEAVFAALPGAVVLSDEGGCISFTNPAAHRLFGYDSGELHGTELSSLFMGNDMATLSTGEWRAVRKDQSIFPVHLEVTLLRLDQGVFHIASLTDLSSRKRMETRLRDSEYRFRQITESLPQLVWTCNPEGNCEYLSQQWVDYTGIPETEQLRFGWMEQVFPEDRPALLAEWTTAVASGKDFRAEYRLRRADGSYRWFEGRGTAIRDLQKRIVKWFGSSMDIDQQRENRMALERERKLLSNLVALAPAVFYSFARHPDGTTTFPYSSPDILALLGVHPEDLKKSSEYIFRHFYPDDLADIMASIEDSAANMTTWRLQFRINHPVRGERWIEGYSTPTPNAGGIIWHGFLTDITERRRLEEDQQFLLKLGSELQKITAPEGIAQTATRLVAEHFDVARCSLNAIDVARQEATLLWSFVRHGQPSTPGTHSLRKWATPELTARLMSGCPVVVDDTALDEMTKANYAASFEPAGILSLLAVPLLRGGELVSVLCLFSTAPHVWQQRETQLACVATERIWPAYEAARALEAERRLHESLAVSEARLRIALQSSSIGIWENYPITGERRWDERCRAIFGIPPDTVIEMNQVIGNIHPEDRDRVLEKLAHFNDPAGDGRIEAEYRISIQGEHRLRHVYAHGQMFFEGEGPNRRAVRALGTVQDVSGLKEREEALRRANLELEQFAYAAAHDLQEPLRNVALSSQLLASRYGGRLDSDADYLMGICVEGPTRMQSMVQDLLAYSRALIDEEGSVRWCDSNAVLQMVLTDLETAIDEKNARIRFDRLPAVAMSDVHLSQVFQNLISNSLKYSGERAPVIQISSEQRFAGCVFFVRDNGVGIDPAYHDRAFGVFKRLHGRSIPGTGIGLALCKRIVEHYGGKIWIESEANAGATVVFAPPVAVGRVLSPTPES